VVIGDSPREARVVYDASPEAATFGVGPGLSLRQAYALCPGAIFLPADEERYRQVMDEVAGILDDFSPVVEVNSLGAAFMDISGVPDEETLAHQIITQVHKPYWATVPNGYQRRPVLLRGGSPYYERGFADRTAR